MKAGVILSLLFFIMALGVLTAFISPINSFLDIAQQSDNLNCKGFIFDGNSTHPLSYNDTKDGGNSGSPLACLSLKLYLPYIFLVFLVFGLSSVMGGRGAELIGIEVGGDQDQFA